MAYRLPGQAAVGHELRRLAMKELRAARKELERTTPPRDEAIHEGRKSVKKVRAIVTLIEADHGRGLADSDKRLTTVNHTLSRLRDADAMMEILTKLRDENGRMLSRPSFNRVRRLLLSHKRAAMDAAERDGAWKIVRQELRKLRRGAKRWRLRHRQFRAIAPGIRSTHRQGRKAMARATTSQQAADFHEWRKQIKALWYELRLIEGGTTGIGRDIAALRRAERWLGDDHNVVVLCEELSKDPSVCGGPVDLDRLRLVGHQYQCALRKKALATTRRIYARKPRQYQRLIERAWKAWQRRPRARRNRPARRAAA